MKAADQLGVDHLQMLVQSLAIGVEVGEILDRQDTVSQIDVEQLLAVGSGENSFMACVSKASVRFVLEKWVCRPVSKSMGFSTWSPANPQSVP